MESARDWNVVVTARAGEFSEAMRLLEPFGRVDRTDYWNVLVLTVDDVQEFLTAITATIEEDASIPNSIAKILPVTHKFLFQSPEQFEEQARSVVEEWVEELKGKSFHVRMHRRGFKGRISSQHEEQFLDHYLLQRLESEGSAGRIDFDDPDVIIAVETVSQQAGLSLWTREERERYEFLNLD